MTNEEALYYVQHKLDLAVDDPLIMTDKEYEIFSLCAKALEQWSVLDKIKAELIQSIQNGTLKIERGNKELFRILDKYKAESEE